MKENTLISNIANFETKEKETLKKIVLDIENYDVNNVTPMEAMKFLFELKEKIKKDN